MTPQIKKLTTSEVVEDKTERIQSEVSQKDKDHYTILTHIYGI